MEIAVSFGDHQPLCFPHWLLYNWVLDNPQNHIWASFFLWTEKFGFVVLYILGNIDNLVAPAC